MVKTFSEVKNDRISDQYFLMFASIRNSIPRRWKTLLIYDVLSEYKNESIYYITIKDCKYDFLKISEKEIYKKLVYAKKEVSKAQKKYSEQFSLEDDDWKNIYLSNFNINLPNKFIELSYKILHNYELYTRWEY